MGRGKKVIGHASKRLAGEFRAEIARKDTNQTKVAKMSGITPSHLSNLLHGRSSITLDEAAHLAQILELDLGRLLKEIADKQSKSV
jgi:transcriptional regulator with XRE-family HTH domain